MLYIYLDQKIWIALARDIVKGTSNQARIDVLNKIRTSVDNGEWAFPLSLVHQLETSKRLDNRTRMELSKVMGDISQNYTIAPYLVYKSKEFLVSLLSLHGVINGKLPLKDQIIKRDYANAVGLNMNDFEITSDNLSKSERESLKNDFLQYIKSKDLFPFYADYFASKELADELQKDSEFYAKCYEEARNQLHTSVPEKYKEYRYRIFLVKYFMEMFREELQLLHSSSAEKKIDIKEIFPDKIFETYESTMNFLCGAPSFHVNATLSYEILNSKDRKLSGNDYLDISFLSSAIPYCDVVVTERSWASIAQKYKLDTTYDTKVFHKIDDLLLL